MADLVKTCSCEYFDATDCKAGMLLTYPKTNPCSCSCHTNRGAFVSRQIARQGSINGIINGAIDDRWMVTVFHGRVHVNTEELPGRQLAVEIPALAQLLGDAEVLTIDVLRGDTHLMLGRQVPARPGEQPPGLTRILLGGKADE